MTPAILCVVGPTASGKSGVALSLAERFNGEIVSADSMQVYRGMDIGTAKPSEEDQDRVPHHLIDLVGPSEGFDVARFQEMARDVIRDISGRGRLPILVGGSGLYVRAVIDDIELAPAIEDSALRAELEARARTEGEGPLREELREVDPESEANIEFGNVRRVVRSLEVFRSTGKRFSEHAGQWEEFNSPYTVEIVGLHRERSELYARINDRVVTMLDQGLEAEVLAVESAGLRESVTARQALGYKQYLEVFDGILDATQVSEEIAIATRRYAKRQLTWFRKDPRVHWVDVTGASGIDTVEMVTIHLSECEQAQEVLVKE